MEKLVLNWKLSRSSTKKDTLKIEKAKKWNENAFLIDNDYLEPLNKAKDDSVVPKLVLCNESVDTFKFTRNSSVKKQLSADSNYFSDTDMNNYDEDDLIDELNIVKQNENPVGLRNSSKNNLYNEVINEELNRNSKKENSIASFFRSRYNRLRTKNVTQTYQRDEESINNLQEHTYHVVQLEDSIRNQDEYSPHVYTELNGQSNENDYATLKKDSSWITRRPCLKRKLLDYEQLSTQLETQYTSKITCLTDIKSPSAFATLTDSVLWYLKLLCDTMYCNINELKDMSLDEKRRRFKLIQAHYLYAKNSFEIKITKSKLLDYSLRQLHPCIISLAFLHESGAVRILDSHSCPHDTYIHLFSTKIKFCNCATLYYIALKKPSRSSMQRLNMINELNYCIKLLKDF